MIIDEELVLGDGCRPGSLHLSGVEIARSPLSLDLCGFAPLREDALQ
jgi:hypothetical protein